MMLYKKLRTVNSKQTKSAEYFLNLDMIVVAKGGVDYLILSNISRIISHAKFRKIEPVFMLYSKKREKPTRV